MIVSHLLASSLVEESYDCLIIRQEAFLDDDFTRPILSNQNSSYLGYDDYNIFLAKNVLRIIKYWLPEQNQLTGDLGFVGISMGGFHAIGAAALYPENKITVAMMCGAPNIDVFKASQEPTVVLNRNRLLKSYIDAFGWQGEIELREDILSVKFNIETFAKSVETNKIKLVVTTEDESVPTFTQWYLYRLLGGPEALVVPSSHLGLAFYYFTVRSTLIDWLNQAFRPN